MTDNMLQFLLVFSEENKWINKSASSRTSGKAHIFLAQH